jgi:hypothetical protein
MSETQTMFYDEAEVDHLKWMRSSGLMSSDSVEWYTPPHVRDAVVQALGGLVDLDPCADPGRTFPATEHYTVQENGLGQRWCGRVYMNPPYGKTSGEDGKNDILWWTTKLRDELTNGWTIEAVALLPARPDTRWWHELAAPHGCFIRGRLRFSGYEQPAPFPSVAVYFGPHPGRFRAAFRPLGQLFRVG